MPTRQFSVHLTCVAFVAIFVCGSAVAQPATRPGAAHPAMAMVQRMQQAAGTLKLGEPQVARLAAAFDEARRSLADLPADLADGESRQKAQAVLQKLRQEVTAALSAEQMAALQQAMRGGPPATRPAGPAAFRVDTSAFKPLTELGAGEYKGFTGGLYPGGANQRPPAHEAAGVALAKQVQPLNADGKPDPAGRIVLLSIGMSNATQEFSTFKRLADPDPDRNPLVVIVDGAQGGQTAARIMDPETTGRQFWAVVEQRLKAAGVTPAQVQAAWIKEADANPRDPFPGHARTLQRELAVIVQHMRQRFPNLKLVYLSSRIYAGYARTPLNPEPFAYETGFAVKWLIEDQIKGEAALNFDPARGEVKAPWLSWGPYLWANGTTRRADGLFYEESDLAGDGTHPSASGCRKVAGLLLDFFKSDSTAKPWFVARK